MFIKITYGMFIVLLSKCFIILFVQSNFECVFGDHNRLFIQSKTHYLFLLISFWGFPTFFRSESIISDGEIACFLQHS